MPRIYAHEGPNARVLAFARARIKEIDEQMFQLQMERDMQSLVITQFRPLVCGTCSGTGTVMMPIKGEECEGPRQHKCPDCGGRKS